MPKGKYRGISLSEDLLNAVERYIKENPSTSYKSLADFVTDAVRKRLEELGALPPTLSLIHLNINENYVLLWRLEVCNKKPISNYFYIFRCAYAEVAVFIRINHSST